jgi:hypothetical protein
MIPANPFKKGQDYDVYQLLLGGPATSLQMATVNGRRMLSVSRRRSDIRKYLRDQGCDLMRTKLCNVPRVFMYEIVEIGG